MKCVAAALATAAMLALPGAASAQMMPYNPDAEWVPIGLVISMPECQANFSIADRNRDGVLDRVEMANARRIIPTTLSSERFITVQDYLSECRVVMMGNVSSN